MARTKKAVLTPPTYKEAQAIVGEYAKLDAKLIEKQALLDQKITTLREEAADELNELKGAKKELLTNIQLFAETNREKYFSKKKSLDMQHGEIGFRIGTPKLTGIPRKGEKLDKLVDYLRQYMPDFLRIKTEINKELIIADREKEETQTHLKVQGLKITRSETFFIELKKEETEN